MANDYLAPPPQGMFDPTPMAPPSSLAQASTGSLAPGGAPAPSPEAQQELAARQRYTGMLDQEISAAQRNISAGGQTARDKATALQPLRDQQLQEAMRPIPQPPTPKKAPQAPDPNAMNGGQEWLTAAMFLGALAGAMTRRPLTNALAGFTGAVQGWEQGKTDQFEKSLKQFEAESKATAQANKEANDAYMQVLKSRELSMEQKSLAIQIVAAKYDDQAAAQLSEAKQHEAVAQLIDQRIRYGADLMKSTTDARNWMAQQEAQRRLESPTGQRYVDAVVKGEVPWPSASGGMAQRNPTAYYYNQAVQDAALERGGNANRYLQERTAVTTRARVEAGREVPMEMAIRNANAVIPNLLEASNAVGAARSTWVPLNQLMQTADAQISDPAVKKFKTLNMEFANLFARTMNPTGVMRVDDREKALQLLNTADSAKTYQENIKTIRGILDREWQSIQDQKAGKPLEGVYWPTAPEPQTAGQVIGTQAGKAGGAIQQTLPAPAGGAAPGTPTGQIPGYSQGRGLSGRPLTDWFQSAPPGTTITPMP